jgi:hypothetical protein
MKIQIYFRIATLILLFSHALFGQNNSHPFMCGYDHVLSINEQQFPGYTSIVNNAFEVAYKLKDENNDARNVVLTIPVVVHVVWKNNEENLDDSLVYSQIKVLNDAFRLQNDDKDNLRAIFKDLQSDAGIEFELKEIKKVKTNANFALSLTGLPDNVKRGANGGSTALDPDRYLNIWVCKIQPIPFIGGQILGYAYPPTGLANWPEGSSAPSKELEGVVIDFRAFGLNNPNKLTVNGMTHESLARTTVHEVGHYLGLRHIWGDGGGLFGGNSCEADDGITDTPNQGGQSPGGCDKSANTCEDEVADLPDMIENYMDYSGEYCQNTFTKEQVAVMRSVLKNQRVLLTNTKEWWSQNQFKVWPNPFNAHFNVVLAQNEMTNIVLRSMDGKVMLSDKISHDKMIDCAWLPKGAYLLEIWNGTKHEVLKLIKSNE